MLLKDGEFRLLKQNLQIKATGMLFFLTLKATPSYLLSHAECLKGCTAFQSSKLGVNISYNMVMSCCAVGRFYLQKGKRGGLILVLP